MMLHTRWSAEAWSVVRVEFRRAVALPHWRLHLSRDGGHWPARLQELHGPSTALLQLVRCTPGSHGPSNPPQNGQFVHYLYNEDADPPHTSWEHRGRRPGRTRRLRGKSGTAWFHYFYEKPLPPAWRPLTKSAGAVAKLAGVLA